MKININNSITILVLAAGKIRSACPYKLVSEDAGFLNIGSTLAINKIIDKSNEKIFMAVNDNSKDVYTLKPFESINFIEVGFTKNIIETIKICLEQIKSEWCLINPITTIPIENKLNESFIEYGSKPIPKENWSSLVLSSK